jgi:hypothetical protein
MLGLFQLELEVKSTHVCEGERGAASNEGCHHRQVPRATCHPQGSHPIRLSKFQKSKFIMFKFTSSSAFDIASDSPTQRST